MSSGLKELQNEIGYSFRNIKLLQEALTHPSAELEFSYERLEFLGDAVLNFCIASMLFQTYSKDDEGALSKKQVSLVCGEAITKVAKRIDVGKHLIFSESEKKSGGSTKQRNLENAIEALIAAIYLDSGLESVESFVSKYWYDGVKTTTYAPIDSKSALQEFTQSKFSCLPIYKILEKSGSDHKPEFKVIASVNGYSSVASASSKKLAEQRAALDLLKKIEKLK